MGSYRKSTSVLFPEVKCPHKGELLCETTLLWGQKCWRWRKTKGAFEKGLLGRSSNLSSLQYFWVWGRWLFSTFTINIAKCFVLNRLWASGTMWCLRRISLLFFTPTGTFHLGSHPIPAQPRDSAEVDRTLPSIPLGEGLKRISSPSSMSGSREHGQVTQSHPVR